MADAKEQTEQKKPEVMIFDGLIQKEVPHTLEIDPSGEIVATSVETGRFVKFPAGISKEEFEQAIANHKKNCENQQVLGEDELKEQEERREASESLLDQYR